MGAVNQLIKFIPNLAQITHGFRDLLKKEGEYNWNEEHDKTFNKIQQSVKDIITLPHFNRNCKLRVICDASKEGIGAMLFPKEEEDWKPIACASRYLSQYESKYSINELELLAVVWSVEHFRNYIYGTQFEVITDHKALISALKSNHGNKTYSSRLTRWIDRLLPFDIQIVHRPGRTMGLVDYLFRHPSEFNEKQSVHNAKELWDSWFTVNTVVDVKTNCKLNQIARSTPQANNIRNENKQPITDEKRKVKLYTPAQLRRKDGVKTKEDKLHANYKNDHLQIVNKMENSKRSLKMKPVKNFKEQLNEGELKRLAEVYGESDISSNLDLFSDYNEEENTQTSSNASIVGTISNESENRDRDSLLGKQKTMEQINECLLEANLEADKELQIVKEAVITGKRQLLDKKGLKRYHQLFDQLRVEGKMLFLDKRVIMPQDLRHALINAIHKGHPGRDAMLASADEFWWPEIHRQIVATAKICPQCKESGKNLKTIKSQKQYGKLTKPEEPNEEIALDFIGPFLEAPNKKKYILTAIDQNSGWPTLQFVRNTTFKSVDKFMLKYIADNGIPQAIRTDQATVFCGTEFKNFRGTFGIKHILSPSTDHRGNGKVERLIRTVNERLRAQPEIIKIKGECKLFGEMLMALRMNKNKDGKSPFERHWGRKPNKIPSIIIKLMKEKNKRWLNLEQDQEKVELHEFPRDADSTIWIRERIRKGKMNSLFKKKRGTIRSETNHTVQFAPAEKQNTKILSKRVIAPDHEVKQKRNRKQTRPKKTIRLEEDETIEDDESIKELPNKQIVIQLESDEEETMPAEKSTEQDENKESPKSEIQVRRGERLRKATIKYGNAIPICNVGEEPEK